MKTITLHTLHCKETEDFTGADTCRIEVRVDSGRTAQYHRNMNNGDHWTLDKTLNFSHEVSIKLWDEDSANSDDLLGTHVISQLTQGRKVATFDRDGAHYRLSYSVVAIEASGVPTDRTSVSFREMAKQMDPLYPPTRFRGIEVPDGGNVMNGPDEHNKGLWPMHRILNRDQNPSLREIARRHFHPATTINKFLFHNTWLLDVAATALTSRSYEFGKTIADHYDIAGLTEVFEAEHLNLIRNQLTGDFRDATGPESGYGGLGYSGGLVTFARSQIVSSQHLVFIEKGSAFSADRWANKGVLLTVLDLGAGKIDLYTTHLFAGEEGDDAYQVRFNQLEELLTFIESTRDPEHVVIVAGDTNIRGEKVRQYSHLEQRMKDHKLYDAWPVHGGPKGTTMFVEEGSLGDRCVLGQPSDGEYFCDDYASEDTTNSDRNNDRVDYIFIEAPTEEHTFNLDVSRVRRKPGWRSWLDGSSTWNRESFYVSRPSPFPGISITEPQYMSDHMGLSTALIASPK